MSAIEEVTRAIDETEQEFRAIPFPFRLLALRGFKRRTGYDFAGWRALLASNAPALRAALPALAEHYRTSPDRVRKPANAAINPLYRNFVWSCGERRRAVEALLATLPTE